ncbi:MAG: diguanylate cyclase [Spirochaetota bacterium]
MTDPREINQLEKKVYDLRNLIEIGISLSSNLEFESLVESLLYSCIGQMFIEKVALLLQVDIDINDYYIHMSKGYDSEFPSNVIITENSPLVQYLESNPHPANYDDLMQVQDIRDELTRMAFLEPEIIVPLKSKNSLNGILILGKKLNDEDFDTSDREFLNYLSRFGAIAVENSRLYLMSTLDRMTRLFIHHYFQIRLLEEMKRSQRYKTPMTIIISDIDHFKNFNDTYGHQQGDIVLKEAAQIFRDQLRKIDLPARYGGEEFAVILPETNLKQAGAVAQRLRQAIESHPFSGQDKALHVTISLGVAEYDVNRDVDSKSLIDRADRAMYKAKQTGRNRVAVFR